MHISDSYDNDTIAISITRKYVDYTDGTSVCNINIPVIALQMKIKEITKQIQAPGQTKGQTVYDSTSK